MVKLTQPDSVVSSPPSVKSVSLPPYHIVPMKLVVAELAALYPNSTTMRSSTSAVIPSARALVAELLNSTPVAVVGHSTLSTTSTTKLPREVSAVPVCQTHIYALPDILAEALLSKAPKIAVHVSPEANAV